MTFERTLEALAVATYFILVLQLGPLILCFFIYVVLFWPIARYFVIAYAVLIFYEFHEVVQKGGRRCKWWRNSYFMRLIIQYFSLKILKTHELDAKKNYIFAGHPHGILTIAGLNGIAYNAANIDTIFPHHKISLITTKYNTCMPLIREMFVSAGDIYASEKSIIHTLTKCGPGRGIALLVGGAREAFLADYNKQRAYALRHKGFCRIALKCGTPIVPFYAFGEVNTYKRAKLEGLGKTIRLYLLKMIFQLTSGAGTVTEGFRFIVPFIAGMPRRTPITVVMGKPIDVEKEENPSKEQIEELHTKYIEGLKNLFNAEKHKYLRDPNQELEII